MIRIEKIKILYFLLCFSLGELSAQTISLNQTETQDQKAPHPQTETTMQTEPVAYDNPETLILDFWSKMKELNNQEIETVEKNEAFRSLFATYFNQKHISRFVLGRYWRTINDQEKEKFNSVFLDYLFLLFSIQMDHYLVKGIFQIKKNYERRPGYHIITSQFFEPDKIPIQIVWVIAKSSQTKPYKVIDIRIEELSLSMSWRTQFSSILRQKNINGLIDRLTELVDQKKESSNLSH